METDSVLVKKLQKLQHRQISSDILKGKKILDIGCGRRKLQDALGLDYIELPGVDIVADLNKPLPIADAEFEAVYADNVLEHVDNLIGLVYEIHRILKPGGLFLAHVPYFRSSWAHIDPTHVRSFTIQGMHYFVKENFMYDTYRFDDRAFDKLEVFIDSHIPSSFFKKFLVSFALINPGYYENSLFSSLFPFTSISYLLTK